MSQICISKFIVAKIMGQAQINVRTRACSRTSIARTRQAALTHNVRGKELRFKVGNNYCFRCKLLCFNVVKFFIHHPCGKKCLARKNIRVGK